VNNPTDAELEAMYGHIMDNPAVTDMGEWFRTGEPPPGLAAELAELCDWINDADKDEMVSETTEDGF
jgi:hypothetical protein